MMGNNIFGGIDVEVRVGPNPLLVAKGTPVMVFGDEAGTIPVYGLRDEETEAVILQLKVDQWSQLQRFWIWGNPYETIYIKIGQGPLTRLDMHPQSYMAGAQQVAIEVLSELDEGIDLLTLYLNRRT